MLILVTVFLVAIIAELVGYSTRAAIETGLLLSQTSEFSLLLALTGVASGQITPELFSMIALITVSTMTLTPLISREWRCDSLGGTVIEVARRLVMRCKTTLFARLWPGGAALVYALKERGISMVVVDEDAGVIRQLIAQGIPCVHGDGSDIAMEACTLLGGGRLSFVQCGGSRCAIGSKLFERFAR